MQPGRGGSRTERARSQAARGDEAAAGGERISGHWRLSSYSFVACQVLPGTLRGSRQNPNLQLFSGYNESTLLHSVACYRTLRY